MKQKIVIKVSMPCDKSRSKALTLAAQADGVIAVITGDDKDKLEVVGDGVDTVNLVSCLRKKLGHADILQVEEVKPSAPDPPQPEAVPPEPFECHFCHHHPPPPMVICTSEEPSNCVIM